MAYPPRLTLQWVCPLCILDNQSKSILQLKLIHLSYYFKSQIYCPCCYRDLQSGNEINEHYFTLSGYSRVCANRPSVLRWWSCSIREGCMYNYKVSRLRFTSKDINDSFSFMANELVFKNRKNIVVGSVYRPSFGKLDLVNENSESLFCAISRKKNGILAGIIKLTYSIIKLILKLIIF